MMKTIYLRKGKDESLRRFHPWVFSGAVHHIEGAVEEGDVVTVLSADGEYMGRGHWQEGSIAVRILTFEDRPIDQSFWNERISEALSLRHTLHLAGREDNDMYRLVHGEGDNLPGLIIDIYGKTAVMQAHSVGMHYARHAVSQALQEVFAEQLTAIYYKSETTLPLKAAPDRVNEFVYGHTDENTARENGLLFHIDWLKGQKTGFFVDQRDNRSLLEQYSRGRKVLNMFCYTGGFSVYAMRGGAEKVHSVDSSAKAVDLVNANVEMNFPNDPRHEAFAEDAFKFLDNMQPDAYDLVILDPPAFAKHRDAIRNALRGYTRLNNLALRKMPAGSILFTFSCSQAISKDQFRMAVFTAAAMAGRRVRILHQLHQPADHPINIYHPEGEYLKGLVLEVE